MTFKDSRRPPAHLTSPPESLLRVSLQQFSIISLMPTLSPLYISTGYERVGHGHERLPDVATCSYAAAMKSGDCSTRGGRRDGGRGGRGSGRVDSSREQKHKDSAAAPGNGRRRRSRGIDPGAFELQLEEQRQRQQQRREGGNGGGERGEDNGGGSAIGEQRTSSVKSGPHNTTPPSISAPSSSDQQRSEQRRPQSLIRGTACTKKGSLRGSANRIAFL